MENLASLAYLAIAEDKAKSSHTNGTGSSGDAVGATHTDQKSNANVVAEFARSALYAAAEEPLRGLSQSLDHFAGTHIDGAVKKVFGEISVEPTKTR